MPYGSVLVVVYMFTGKTEENMKKSSKKSAKNQKNTVLCVRVLVLVLP